MTNIWAWSPTAGSNSNADSGINWSENQAASTVNDSARVMMKRVAEFLDDIGGTVTTGGTGNAQTLSAISQFAAYADGIIVGFTAGNSNTAAATLNVNDIGAKSIYANGAVLTGGEIVAGGVYVCAYDPALNGAAGGWHLLNPRATSLALTGVSSITVSSSSDAFKITQTGSGNSFVVEDAASTDATPFVIDTNGNEILGHTAALATYLDDETAVGTAGTAKTQQHGVDEDLSAKAITRWTAGAGGPHIILAKSRSGTVGTYTVVQSGDTLGSISFQGSDGTDFAKGAVIKAVVNATPGSNDLPTRLDFMTTPDGSATPAVGMSQNENGKLITKATVAASAGLNIPNGTAPSSPVTGDVWAVSGVLNYYDGTASRAIANANLWTISDLTLAAGGMLYAAGVGNWDQLAIGTAGQVLTVNTGATAPQWSSPAYALISAATPPGGSTSYEVTVDWTIYSIVEVEMDALAGEAAVVNIQCGPANSGGFIAFNQIVGTTAIGGAATATADRYTGRTIIVGANTTASSSHYHYTTRTIITGQDASAVTTYGIDSDTDGGGSATRADRIRINFTGGINIANAGQVRVVGRRRSF